MNKGYLPNLCPRSRPVLLLFLICFAVDLDACSQSSAQVDSTVRNIRRQAEYEKRHVERTAEERATASVRQGEFERASIDDQARRHLQDLSAARNLDPSSRNVTNPASVMQAAELEKQYASKAAEQRANYHRAVGEWRRRALDEAAGNLERQLTGSGNAAVRLIPQGTNLYVRNYAFSTSRAQGKAASSATQASLMAGPAQSMRATISPLPLSQRASKNASPASSKSTSLGAELKVRGQVLPNKQR